MNAIKIGIIGGNGRYGTFWAKYFRERGYEVLSSDIGTELTNEQVVESANVIIIAVTLMETVKVITSLAPLLNPNHLVMDMSSTKIISVEALQRATADVVGLHPFCAPPRSGTFRGQTIFVSGVRTTRWQEWFANFLLETGANIKEIKPGDHDMERSIDQVLEHMCTFVKAQVMQKMGLNPGPLFEVASPVYRLTFAQMGRMFAQSADLYGGIAMSNMLAQTALLHFETFLGSYLEMVIRQDMEGYRARFEANAVYLGEENLKASLDLSEELIIRMNKLRTESQASAEPPTEEGLGSK